jgi:hypothetical protein
MEAMNTSAMPSKRSVTAVPRCARVSANTKKQWLNPINIVASLNNGSKETLSNSIVMLENRNIHIAGWRVGSRNSFFMMFAH